MKTLASLVAVIACAGAALLVIVYFAQAHLVYFPQVGRDVRTTPAVVGLTYEDIWLESAPGVTIHGWFVAHPAARGAVLFFHGNAGSVALRLDWLRMFHDLGYATLVIDYRGYGRSAGRPSERGTYEDATAAWRYLTQDRAVAAHDIVIAGESLGAAVATELASRTEPRALVIQSTFTSIPELGAELYPFLPVRWLSRIDYDTRLRIGRVAAPVLVAHSPADEIIPYRHGKAIYEAAREPKVFVELAGGHNEGILFVRPEWVAALDAFLRRSQR